jgi:hypothetical protein
VIFRDESKNVVRKAKAKEARAKQAASKASTPTVVLTEEDTDSSSEESCELLERTNSALECYALAPNIEDRATGFFIANYVVLDNGPTRRHLNYLVDIYRSQSLDECLNSSMKAVGLAAFAHTASAPSLLKNARYQYVKALQYTNKALASPVGAKTDTHITRHLNPRNIRIHYGIQSAMCKKLRRTQFVLSVLSLRLAY